MDMTPAFAGALAEPSGLDAHDLFRKKRASRGVLKIFYRAKSNS
jgi:hypothetical protein